MDELRKKMETLKQDNEEKFTNLETSLRRAHDLLDQGHDRQEEMTELLTRLDELHAQAKHDVEQTNLTLQDANAIYNTLKSN